MTITNDFARKKNAPSARSGTIARQQILRISRDAIIVINAIKTTTIDAINSKIIVSAAPHNFAYFSTRNFQFSNSSSLYSNYVSIVLFLLAI